MESKHNITSSLSYRSVPYIIVISFIAASMSSLIGIGEDSRLFLPYRTACLFLGLLVVFFALVRHIIKKKNRTEILINQHSFIFAGFYIVASVLLLLGTSTISIQHGGGIQFLIPTITAIVTLVMLGQYRIHPRDVPGVFAVVLVFCFIASIYNLIINFDTVKSLASITSSYDTDFRGFFTNRNTMGQVMAIGALCGSYLTISSHTNRRTFFAMTAVVILSLVLSMSRGGIMLFFIALVVFLLARSGNIVKTIIVITLASLLLLPVANTPFVQDNIIRADKGDTHRGALREYAAQYREKVNPIFGEGTTAVSMLQKETGFAGYHNLYLETLLVKGVVGLTLLTASVLYAIRSAYKVRRVDRGLGSLLIGLIVAFVAYSYIEVVYFFISSVGSILITFMVLLLPIFIVNHINHQNSEKGLAYV